MQVCEKDEYETIEWGKDPKDGMILIGFSCEAVIEGKDLKRRIVSSLKNSKKLGYRVSVKILMDEAWASFNEAKNVVDEIKKDLSGDRGVEATIINKSYKYEINRIFWGYKEGMPKNDPRYFILNMVDCREIEDKKYINPDSSFNTKRFINENLSEESRKILNLTRNAIETEISAPEINIQDNENEWK
jgi:hypothetical protein